MQNMQLTQAQVNVAIAAGLAITNPEDEHLYVPMKHAAGALVLRSLLTSIAKGAIGLQSLLKEEPPKEPEKEPAKEPAKEPTKEPEGKTPPAPKSPKKKTSRKKRVAAKKK